MQHCNLVNLHMFAYCCVWNCTAVEIYGLQITLRHEYVKFPHLAPSVFTLSIPPSWRRVWQWRYWYHYSSCILLLRARIYTSLRCQCTVPVCGLVVCAGNHRVVITTGTSGDSDQCRNWQLHLRSSSRWLATSFPPLSCDKKFSRRSAVCASTTAEPDFRAGRSGYMAFFLSSLHVFLLVPGWLGNSSAIWHVLFHSILCHATNCPV